MKKILLIIVSLTIGFLPLTIACPSIPNDDGATLVIPTNAECQYPAKEFFNNSLIITGDGDIIIIGDAVISKKITIASATAKIIFQGSITIVAGGSIENDGILEFSHTLTLNAGNIINNGTIFLKGDFEQKSGSSVINEGTIRGENIAFIIASGEFHNNANLLIDNSATPTKTISITGDLNNKITFNVGSKFWVSGSDVKLLFTSAKETIINGEIYVFNADLHWLSARSGGNNHQLTISKTGKITILDTIANNGKGIIHIVNTPPNNSDKATITLNGPIYANGLKGNGITGNNGGTTDIVFNGSNALHLIAGRDGLDGKFKEKGGNNDTNIKTLIDCSQTPEDPACASCDNGNTTSIQCLMQNNDSEIILPVSLSLFTAKTEDSLVRLQWETKSENDNDFFTLYRSKDGSQFTEFAIIAGAGTSNEATQYEYIDNNPLSGISYYRLSQTDLDGTTTYHNIVPTFTNSESDGFSVANSSFNGIATLQCHFSETKYANIVKIYSLAGELQYEKTVDVGITNCKLYVPLEAGIYMVANTHGSTSSLVKILVQ